MNTFYRIQQPVADAAAELFSRRESLIEMHGVVIPGDFSKNGDTLEDALKMRLSLSVDELEEHWRTHLKAGPSWLVYLADHIYGIVFFRQP